MLWIIFGIMLLVAALLVAWPLYRHDRRLTPLSAVSVAVLVAVAAGLYSNIGSPGAGATAQAVPSVGEMVASLDARLQENPEDLDGWKMLGRSYMQLGDTSNAIMAFEKAAELENSQNGDTLISLGEAVLTQDRSSIAGRAGQLFESGLALSPNNPQGLFFGGLSALQRGNQALAADRWEALLALAPPPEIQDILRQRIAEWRGEPPPTATTVAGTSGPLSIDVQVSDAAASAIQPSSSVFVIARDPNQPAPPVAVARRKAGELPAVVSISDDDAMIPGRVPSGFTQLEIVVRVSASGQPIAQPGDWYGEAVYTSGQGDPVSIIVDRQVQ